MQLAPENGRTNTLIAAQTLLTALKYLISAIGNQY